MAFIPVMIVGGQLLIAVADGIPQVNFEQTCRAAASEALGMNDRFDDCVKSERRARELLGKQWSGFDAADRARCGRTATGGGASSYVELLTCLEMQKGARSLHPRTETAIIEPEPPRERESLDPPVEAPPPAPRRVEPAAPPAPRRFEAAARPAPLPLTPSQPTEVSQGELLKQSLCRSPLGYVVPSCGNQGSDARDQRSDARDQASDVRCQRSDARGHMPEIRCGRSDGAP
jgi:hypothetical protein